jgi:hypothetical protein
MVVGAYVVGAYDAGGRDAVGEQPPVPSVHGSSEKSKSEMGPM